MNNESLLYQEDFFHILSWKKRVRYGFRSTTKKSALVLVPHPDDETIGCGGTIHRLINEGFEIEVLLFTNENREDIDRIMEFKQAMQKLGCDRLHIFSRPDGELIKHKDEVKEKVCNIINECTPGLIFTPYLLDGVLDHKATNLILLECLCEKAALPEDCLIAMYEVWALLQYPDYYIDISDIYDIKESALRSYKSQEERYNIISKARRVSALRADLSFRKNVKYTECFKTLTVNQYIGAGKYLKLNNWFDT